MQSCPEAVLSLCSSVISVILLVLPIPQLHCSLLVMHGVSYAHSNGQTEMAIHYTPHGGSNRQNILSTSAKCSLYLTSCTGQIAHNSAPFSTFVESFILICAVETFLGWLFGSVLSLILNLQSDIQ